jgi:outer membrane protein
MTRLSKFTLLTLLSLFSVLSLNAQKFGYINSAQLLLEMPQIKAADTQLESFQQGLLTAGQTMVKNFEEKYNKYMADANAGLLSQIQMQEREGDLQKDQQQIQQYELKVQQDVAGKREELYKPILDKVKTELEAFGKEQGYTMIFDTSTGTILHANDGDNIMAQMKQRLGI